ncbi:type II methionyl aminopeptidase [Candidatus Woesearchaeota archaeon]|nr:type II methionyl aminopeptidase [Candidatus Woesearchaeota archaeon]
MEEETLKKYLEAGRIAAEALEFGRGLVRPGVKILDVAEQVEAHIVKLGGVPAFPMNISFNDTAAHYTPSPGDETVFDDQVVKLDVGAHVDGFVGGDTALTVDLSGKYSDLVNASRDALDAALKVVQVGTTLGEIGREIEAAIISHGFNPVRNLSGHGIGEWDLHTGYSIPNYDTKDDTPLEDGMTIAIEPFASTGVGLIHDKGVPFIHSIIGRKPVRNIVTRQVMKRLDDYNGLPFATRWLTKDMPLFKVNFALKELNQLDILKSYSPLVERAAGAFVSQAEHSVYVGDKVIVMTRF